MFFVIFGTKVGALELIGKATQGGLIQGQLPSGTKLSINDVPLAITSNGIFVFGLNRNSEPKIRIEIRFRDGSIENKVLTITKRKYKIQKIEGLARTKVTPRESDYKRIIAEHKMLQAARSKITLNTGFRRGFTWPVRGKITGVYGSQRILNGKPRAPHYGVDISAPKGSPVAAAADGVVGMTHLGMFFTGKTIHIDHGLGIGTVYAHLDKINVKLGSFVKKGEVIGKVGKTGRATGPHLHWGLSWKDIRLDPTSVLGKLPKRILD
ncbi:MAG: M23 family metallopeptidase [Pseudomonadota bacterium]|nr:M23 family metallopeptidase [Pseudomonadota bacterium]